MRGGVGVARGDDGGRAVILLVVVEIEEIGGCEAFARANIVRGLFVDGLEVLVFLRQLLTFFSRNVGVFFCVLGSLLRVLEGTLVLLAVGVDVPFEGVSIGLVASRRREPVEVSDIVRAVVDEELLALLGQ